MPTTHALIPIDSWRDLVETCRAAGINIIDADKGNIDLNPETVALEAELAAIQSGESFFGFKYGYIAAINNYLKPKP